MTKSYKISSVGKLWDDYTMQVDKNGYVIGVTPNDGAIVIGSKFESLREFWAKFQGENGYKVEELNEPGTK